jgi:hydroxyacylglutathione hydrolase
VTLRDGEVLKVLGGAAEVTGLHVPYHTRGHTAFLVRERGLEGDCGDLFSGDALFGAGCGKINAGGSAEELHAAMSRFAALPADTRVWFGHEYTEANLLFAKSVEPSNAAVAERADRVRTLRAAGKFSVPSTIAEERSTNPFFRFAEPGIRASVGASASTSDIDVVGAVRAAKNIFKPPL